MLNSKQLIEITGISRATLNNYVALGILPNPVVRTLSGEAGRATRLGYFENDAIDCIKKVKRLKKQGHSMAQIAAEIGARPPTLAAVPKASPTKSSTGEQGSLTNLSLEASIDNFPGPAYMVNNNFELIWWNREAATSFFSSEEDLPGDLESRNLLKLLFGTSIAADTDQLKDLLKPHVAAIKKRLSQQALMKIYSTLNAHELALLKELYDAVEPVGREPMIHFPTILPGDDGEPMLCDLYVCFYREGILFTFSPVLLNDDFLLEFLSKRNHVINELLKKRKPYLTAVTVMVADVQNSTKICSELPAEEYFELIGQPGSSLDGLTYVVLGDLFDMTNGDGVIEDPSSFGRDAYGDIYICDLTGEVYKIIRADCATDDCNANGVEDACDILDGSSADSDENGLPDECILTPPGVPNPPHDIEKNRYITFAPNNAGVVAFEVALPDGRQGWVGQPQPLDWAGTDPAAVSAVVANPVFRIWTESEIHVTGCVIVPNQTYPIRTTE
ncbi:MAG: MerR family transcriptional regulator, partial [Proteobacteria bacterium]|nr:MerR family transcriptional regulator [Pseudomonadota bacterium]